MLRLRQSHLAGLSERCHRVGISLRKLQAACDQVYDKQLLGMVDRVNDLECTYGVHVARKPVARIAYQRLVEAGSELKSSMFRCTWGHGDFRPVNLLFVGHKYVGIDTLLETRSAVLYDLASFLDDLLPGGRTMWHRDMRRSFRQAGERFLAGYGNLDGSVI